jgi:uncharacterized protein YbjQ (UPF0145 family)
MHFVRFGFVISMFLLAALLVAAPAAFARDEVVMIPIASVMNMPEAHQKLGDSVKFTFGAQPAGRVAQDFGPYVVNPKTNGFAKSADKACEWAFLSALISLQDHAASVGANAVINIVSYYDKHVVTSDTAFECHKGFLMAGVALRGDVVRLAGH